MKPWSFHARVVFAVLLCIEFVIAMACLASYRYPRSMLVGFGGDVEYRLKHWFGKIAIVEYAPWENKEYEQFQMSYRQLSLLPLLAGGILFIAGRRPLAKPEHRCLHCGYDLRATLDRCPECGAPVPEGHAPTVKP